jgi:hypothetical protein
VFMFGDELELRSWILVFDWSCTEDMAYMYRPNEDVSVSHCALFPSCFLKLYLVCPRSMFSVVIKFLRGSLWRRVSCCFVSLGHGEDDGRSRRKGLRFISFYLWEGTGAHA